MYSFIQENAFENVVYKNGGHFDLNVLMQTILFFTWIAYKSFL